MMMKRFLQTLSLPLLLLSCEVGNACAAEMCRQEATSDRQISDGRQFPFPEIPFSLQTPGARKDYLLRHYWDKFDFADGRLLAEKDIAEQGFVNFIALLADGETDDKLATVAMNTFCRQMTLQEEARKVFLPMAKSYLFDTRSPMYNEGMYALFLHSLSHVAEKLDEAERQRTTFLLKLIERNRPGEKATDFNYYLPDGKEKRLSDTPVDGNWLILLFYDPECEQCRETLGQMKADARLAEAVRQGRLTVLAIYTEGDEEVWHKTLDEIPKGWVVGSDRSIIKDRALYDLKAMPSLYLLDAGKRVLVKDGAFDTISSFIYSSQNIH